MSAKQSIAVCLVTWNGGPIAAGSLQSALRQEQVDPFVIVVDNNSGAGDRQALLTCAGSDPRVEFVWNETNRGFAAAANQGIERALARGCRWVLLLTQDTILKPNTCRTLLEVAEEIPNVGIVGPVVIDRSSRRVLSVGERVRASLLALPRALIRYRATREPYRLVEGVVGCCLLLAVSCWERLGGFREDLFAYYEEVDLCLRARQHGYQIAVVPRAEVEHEGWRGFGRGLTPTSAALKSRNLLLLVRAHVPWWQWVIAIPLVSCLLVSSTILYAARGQWRVVAAMLRGVRLGVAGRAGALHNPPLDGHPCVLP
ncbi:MAG: glycosyltransferase family 2 protein [Candidatus Binatia bacterium]|nr:glycosyltransferase family 2 protein [Candidatus Binatia bacterium]